MSHYFTKKPEVSSKPQTINYAYLGHDFEFTTDQGVFSKDHVDLATNLLLSNTTVTCKDSVLDLGCGYGVIGIVLAKIFDAKVTLSDVNQRALSLAKNNAKKNNTSVEVIESDGFEHINKTFDLIITNPPIRIGKPALYQLFLDAISHLETHGTLLFVMHKKHGVESAIRFLSTNHNVSLINKHKGFHVVACNKR